MQTSPDPQASTIDRRANGKVVKPKQITETLTSGQKQKSPASSTDQRGSSDDKAEAKIAKDVDITSP